MSEFINLTPENLPDQHLCCIIRTKKPHPGVEAKRAWLAQRLKEGHVFRKLDEKATVFIEYAPLEKAWVPIEGENFLYIYCLWVNGDQKSHGYGKELMEYCIADAKAKGKSGICMLGSQKQKAWLSDKNFAQKFGFEAADITDNGYELLCLSFDGTKPRFCENAKHMAIPDKDLTVYYSEQCPYTYIFLESIEKYCSQNSVPLNIVKVDTLQKAKSLPCVFNNWAVFYGGEFKTVNLIDAKAAEKLIKKK